MYSTTDQLLTKGSVDWNEVLYSSTSSALAAEAGLYCGYAGGPVAAGACGGAVYNGVYSIQDQMYRNGSICWTQVATAAGSGAVFGAAVGALGKTLSPIISRLASRFGESPPNVLRIGGVKLSAVPKGAVGKASTTGKGLEYPIPPGTPELSDKVASIRIMDPVTTGKYQYPNGYAVYMNKSGQTINPLTGQTIANSDPYAHIPLP